MPKRMPKLPSWSEAPVVAPIPSGKNVRPFQKREPVAWPLTRPLKEVAEQLAGMMNTHPKLDRPDPGLKWALAQYAEHGALPTLAEWPKRWRDEAAVAIAGHRFDLSDSGRLHFGYFGPGIGPHTLKGPAHWWFNLLVLQAHGIPIRRCPVEKCGRFFADTGHRGKTVCSPKCGSVIRARAHYQKVKSKPRKYNLYLRKQAALMRDRRAAGLA